MEDLVKVSTYQEYKKAMDTELCRSTESFVRIGYLLKMARDTDILKESGYANVVDFAQREYNLDKTQVSRFIRINDKFSEGGCSDRLQTQYREFGYAKLALMLQLPDEINEVLTPDFSKAEIQMLKEEVDAEKELTDLEVMLEGENEQQKDLESNMHKALHQMFRENPEMYVEVHDAMGAELGVLETLAPSGTAMISVRIQGMGRCMISIREDEDVQLVNVRTGEVEKYPWQQVYKMLESMINAECEAKLDWERIYGEKFPEKEKVAPVQPVSTPTKTPEKPAARKESKVVKSKPAPKKEPAKEPEVVKKPAEEPEVIPAEEIEVVEKPENVINAELEPHYDKKTLAGYKAGITSKSRQMTTAIVKQQWSKVAELAADILHNAKILAEAENGEK